MAQRTIWQELDRPEPISTFVGGVNLNPTIDRIGKLRAQVQEKKDKLNTLKTHLDSLEPDYNKQAEEIKRYQQYNKEISEGDVFQANRAVDLAANDFATQLANRNTKLGSINNSLVTHQQNLQNAEKSKSDVALPLANLELKLYKYSGGVKPENPDDPDNSKWTGHLRPVNYAEPKSDIETANKVMSGWIPDKTSYKSFSLPGQKYIEPKTGKEEVVPQGEVVVHYGNSIKKITANDVVPSLKQAFKDDNYNYLFDKNKIAISEQYDKTGELENLVKIYGREKTEQILNDKAKAQTDLDIESKAKVFASKIISKDEEAEATINHFNQFGEGGSKKSGDSLPAPVRPDVLEGSENRNSLKTYKDFKDNILVDNQGKLISKPAASQFTGTNLKNNKNITVDNVIEYINSDDNKELKSYINKNYPNILNEKNENKIEHVINNFYKKEQFKSNPVFNYIVQETNPDIQTEVKDAQLGTYDKTNDKTISKLEDSYPIIYDGKKITFKEFTERIGKNKKDIILESAFIGYKTPDHIEGARNKYIIDDKSFEVLDLDESNKPINKGLHNLSKLYKQQKTGKFNIGDIDYKFEPVDVYVNKNGQLTTNSNDEFAFTSGWIIDSNGNYMPYDDFYGLILEGDENREGLRFNYSRNPNITINARRSLNSTLKGEKLKTLNTR